MNTYKCECDVKTLKKCNYCKSINNVINKTEIINKIDQKNNICICGNIFSVKCIDKLCDNCCKNYYCKKHGMSNIIKKQNAILEQKRKDKKELCCFELNDLEMYYKLLTKIIHVKELRDIVMEFIDERLRCNECKIFMSYIYFYVKKCEVCKFYFCEKCSDFTDVYNKTIKYYCGKCYDPKIHEIRDDYYYNNNNNYDYQENDTSDDNDDSDSDDYSDYSDDINDDYHNQENNNKEFEIITNNTNCDLCYKNDNETFNCNKCEKLFWYDCMEYQDEFEPCNDDNCTICDLQNEWYCKFIGRCCIECFPYEY